MNVRRKSGMMTMNNTPIKSKYIYDIEVFPNFFGVTFLNEQDINDIRYFIICWDLKIDEREKLINFLNTSVDLLIGFNNLYYDYPILSLIYNYNGSDINNDIFDLSVKIISNNRDDGNYKFAHYNNYLWKQVDLMKIMGFDKLGIGLKQISINLQWHKIQDLPLDHNHIVTVNDLELIKSYNYNDVAISHKLYEVLQPQIQLRQELSTHYAVDLQNASESKIANVLLEKFYETESRKDIRDIRKLRTKRQIMSLSECVGKNINFKTAKLQNLYSEICDTIVVAENNFVYNKDIDFANCTYNLGVGGLHTQDKPNIFYTDEKYIIIDADVTSYYPNIIINNKLIPEHLDETFITILKKITEERIEAKKNKDKVKADGLKITVNSIFGKLGSDTFWLEDFKQFISVTISGQLYLLMLIEELTINNILVISANTDGVVCKLDRNLESKYNEVCKNWESKTGFALEFTTYATYIRSDVNNYITKKSDNSTKEKGRFVKEIDLKKGYKHPIIPNSIYEYFVNNVPVADTINNNHNILNFCISQKAGGDFSFEFHSGDTVVKLQKTNRFYVSKNGGKLIKRNRKKDSTIGLFVNETVTILNDYDYTKEFVEYDVDLDYYIAESNKCIAEIETATFSNELLTEIAGTTGFQVNKSVRHSSNTVIKLPKFRHSRGSYYYNSDEDIVYRGISSIKFINYNCGEELYRLKDVQYDSFIDFLVSMCYNEYVTNSQIKTLIALNYFEEFGNNGKLLNIYNEFTSGKSKYSKTLVSNTKNIRLLALKEYAKREANVKLNPIAQYKYEQDYTGDIYSTYPVLGETKYIYITALDMKFSPRITTFCLNNGVKSQLKIEKSVYKGIPFRNNDILVCKKFKSETKKQFMSDGVYKEIENEKEWWLAYYELVKPETLDELINR